MLLILEFKKYTAKAGNETLFEHSEMESGTLLYLSLLFLNASLYTAF